MLRKLLHGLLLGAGFGIGFSVVITVYYNVVLPQIFTSLTKSPDMTDASTAVVVPIEQEQELEQQSKIVVQQPEREYKLHIGVTDERKIPTNGGMLSIAVIETPVDMNRPSTFQAWVTEKEAFIVSTEGEVPKIKKVSYPDTKAADYASKLVHDNVGFREQNLTVTIDSREVQGLKEGKSSNRDTFLNGTFRITKEGVVFFLPNEYGT